MLIGNLLSVDAEQPIQDLMRIASEHGPIFWLDMMGKPVVVVSGADWSRKSATRSRFDKAVRGVAAPHLRPPATACSPATRRSRTGARRTTS